MSYRNTDHRRRRKHLRDVLNANVNRGELTEDRAEQIMENGDWRPYNANRNVDNRRNRNVNNANRSNRITAPRFKTQTPQTPIGETEEQIKAREARHKELVAECNEKLRIREEEKRRQEEARIKAENTAKLKQADYFYNEAKKHDDKRHFALAFTYYAMEFCVGGRQGLNELEKYVKDYNYTLEYIERDEFLNIIQKAKENQTLTKQLQNLNDTSKVKWFDGVEHAITGSRAKR